MIQFMDFKIRKREIDKAKGKSKYHPEIKKAKHKAGQSPTSINGRMKRKVFNVAILKSPRSVPMNSWPKVKFQVYQNQDMVAGLGENSFEVPDITS